MKSKAIIIVVSLLTLLIAVGVMVIDNVPDMQPVYKVNRLAFTKYNETLYLKSKSWGGTYDHQVAVLSTSPEEKFSIDSTKDFVYKGSFLFYKVTNDSLLLYVYDRPTSPPLLKSKIKIIQIELENSKMMRLFEHDAYKSKGLTKFN